MRTGSARGPDHRYEPPRDPFVSKHSIFGAPDEKRMSTAHVERFNLTARHVVGRTRRLCLAFSKTKRGHEAAMSVGIAAYNFVRIHSTIDETPAQAAGLTDHPWTMAELVERALAEVTTDKPAAVPLALSSRTTGPTRELPNGRGFLRAVGSTGAPSEPSGPASPPDATAAPALPVQLEAVADDRQLDLLAWRPRPPAPSRRIPPGQLSMFGIDFEPEPKK